MKHSLPLSCLLLLLSFRRNASPQFATAFSLPPLVVFASAAVPSSEPPLTPTGPKKVAVAGATGRTGRLVVQELLQRDVNVVALVRDLDKAKEILPSGDDKLSVVKCDLSNEDDIRNAVGGCDAALWCATGFSDARASLFGRLKSLLGLALFSRQSIDLVAVPTLAEAFLSKSNNEGPALPKVVMLSSAGVTRPSWDTEKKESFPGAADIPIVRLNPFGILDIKAESEEKLRQSGVDYCIFRPCGLNNEWPVGSRPIFSQGDLAVGRINRADVAKILVDILSAPEAVGKTFEGITVKGYPPARSLNAALTRLRRDSEGVPSIETLAATYSVLQQLLPGEAQDSAGLAMGQTYEELDKNEVGRLGNRGKEDAEAAAPKPSS